MEYRIYRKLREKLRNFIENKKVSKQNIFERYIKEVKELTIDNPPHRPLEFYFCIGKIALDFADSYPKDVHYIHD